MIALARSVVAGAVGAVTMSAGQELELRLLTRRAPSHSPAAVATALLGLAPREGRALDRLNWTAHLTGASAWGPLGAGLRRATGLRGPRASLLLFAVVWPLECAGLVRAGIAEPPWTWSRQGLAVDVGHKVVLALVSGAVYDHDLS